MKRLVTLLLCGCLCLNTSAFAEEPPAKPAEGTAAMTESQPPMPPDGERPHDMMPGAPPAKPDGAMGDFAPPDMPGGFGGMGGAPETYEAMQTVDADANLAQISLVSSGTDENALCITAGDVSLTDAAIVRASSDSTGGDASSFYGVGAAVLATGGTLAIGSTTIETDSAGGAGVFAYGDSVVTVSDTAITTKQNTSGGIHVAGGGTLYANNVTSTTEGASSAAIRSDRGGGTMVVNGGSYTSHGEGSPAVYVTADISISDAALTATGSEALCLEGRNHVTLNNCTLRGDMRDLSVNDNTWTVILYQSMSGDSELGKGTFAMTGGKLISGNGGLFYTTNTESEFTLSAVEIEASEDCEYFLRCTGNRNQRGWGQRGQNGAQCTFTVENQPMNGDVIWDSISTLALSITEGSTFTGAVVQDESAVEETGDGTCRVVIDASSKWIVTGDSVITSLDCDGVIMDEAGNDVTVLRADGTVVAQGSSAYTITVSE